MREGEALEPSLPDREARHPTGLIDSEDDDSTARADRASGFRPVLQAGSPRALSVRYRCQYTQEVRR